MSEIDGAKQSARIPKHPVRVVARMTGLTPHVLRAWERRYAVVEPVRTEGGQRLYTDRDVRRLRMLQEATAAGHSISRLVTLSEAELADLIESRSAGTESENAGAGISGGDALHAEIIQAASLLDARRLQAALTRAAIAMRASEFIDRVAQPLLSSLGERWQQGGLRPLEEHIVSVGVRRVLLWLMDMFDPAPGAPAIVFGTMPDELHEFGAMMAGVIAAEERWRVIFLGPSLPAEEIAAAALRSNARITAVSTVYSPAVHESIESIQELTKLLDGKCTVITGGRALAPHAERIEAFGARYIYKFDDLRALLRLEQSTV